MTPSEPPESNAGKGRHPAPCPRADSPREQSEKAHRLSTRRGGGQPPAAHPPNRSKRFRWCFGLACLIYLASFTAVIWYFVFHD